MQRPGNGLQRPVIGMQRPENRNVPPINNNPIRIKDHFKSAISPKAHSISVIVRSYKSAVTRQANMLGYRFGWQGKFHDSIIRNAISFFRVGRYIKNNPKKWSLDGKN